MFTWAEVVLLALKVANAIMGAVGTQQAMDAGRDRAIGEAALGVLRQTTWGKAIAEKIDAMGEPELSDLERELERGDTGKGG